MSISRNQDYNPHIRGMKVSQTTKKLSQNCKSIIELIFPKQVVNDPLSYRRIPKQYPPRFTPVSNSPPRHFVSSQVTSRLVSKSPSKENLSRKRGPSPEEQAEIEDIIQTKLKQEYISIKKHIENKLKASKKLQVFSNEMNSLRADTLASVQAKLLEKKILPKLRREATSLVMLQRRKKPPLDKNTKRVNVLANMEKMLVNNKAFVPMSFGSNGQNVGIDDIYENAKKGLRKYSVKPIESYD